MSQSKLNPITRQVVSLCLAFPFANFDIAVVNVKLFEQGSGCGAVGRAVASDTRGPRFESSHRQLLLNIYLLLTVCRKDKNKEKEAGNGPFKKK